MCFDPIEKTRRYKQLLEDDSDIMFFFRGEFVPQKILEKIKAIKVQLSSEPIPTANFSTADRVERLKMLIQNKNKFDYFYHYDKTSIPILKNLGFEVDGEFVFPVATEFYKPLESEKIWDAGIFGRSTVHREVLLGIPKRDFEILHVAHGVIGKLWVKMINQCRLGLNIHVDMFPSLENRTQMMMACGIPVISEPFTHNDMFEPGKHFIEIDCTRDPRDLINKIMYYLENKKEREQIAKAGLEFVRENLNSYKCFSRLIKEVQK